MAQLVTVFHVFVCLLLIGVVLLQQGRGADVGASFGGGSNTLFGASGADNFLTRFTTITAVLFMATSLVLATLGQVRTSGDPSEGGRLFKDFQGTSAPAAPGAAPESPAAPSGEAAPVAGPAEAPAAANSAPQPVAVETSAAPQ